MNTKDYSGKDFYLLAINYAYKISEDTEFMTGFSVTQVKMNFTNTMYWKDNFSYTYDDSLNIFSVPVGLRYYFGRYLYTHGGVNINYHPYKGYSWGFGGFIGLGAQYLFKSGLALSLTPQVNLNMLYLSNFDEKLTQIGINFGVGYRF